MITRSTANWSIRSRRSRLCGKCTWTISAPRGTGPPASGPAKLQHQKLESANSSISALAAVGSAELKKLEKNTPADRESTERQGRRRSTAVRSCRSRGFHFGQAPRWIVRASAAGPDEQRNEPRPRHCPNGSTPIRESSASVRTLSFTRARRFPRATFTSRHAFYFRLAEPTGTMSDPCLGPARKFSVFRGCREPPGQSGRSQDLGPGLPGLHRRDGQGDRHAAAQDLLYLRLAMRTSQTPDFRP